jgi:site-specific DNA recombinase
MVRVVLYARFSPRPDAAESESNVYQLDLCRLYAARQGWEIKGEFQDEALSGDDVDRRHLWEALDCLAKGDVLLVHRLDRLSRSEYMDWIIREAVAKAGARIVSVTGEGTASDSPEDLLIRRVLQALSEYVKRAQAARTKAAMLRHQANGRRMSREDRTPFGWQPDPRSPLNKHGKPGGLRQVVAEQALISRIKQLYAHGLGARAIARHLNAEGATCRGRR